jgi:hypothetical protein
VAYNIMSERVITHADWISEPPRTLPQIAGYSVPPDAERLCDDRCGKMVAVGLAYE